MDEDQISMPTDNEGWFKRYIVKQLDRQEKAIEDLKKGQEENVKRQQAMHESNIQRMTEATAALTTHAEQDAEHFATLRQAINDFQPVKKAVFGAITVILLAVVTALIALILRQGPSLPK